MGRPPSYPEYVRSEALDMYATEGPVAASREMGVPRRTIERWAEKADLRFLKEDARPEMQGPHGLARGLAGCRCGLCQSEVRQTQRWLDDYLSGETFEYIANLVGLSKERVRQRLNLLVGGSAFELKRQLRREREQRELRERQHPCVMCGTVTTNKRTCGGECSEDYQHLRYVIADEETWQAHRKQVARVLISGDGPGRAARYALKVIGGNASDEPSGRWMVPGSQVHQVATEAWRTGAPIVEEFPEWARRQLRGECTQCGDPVDKGVMHSSCHWLVEDAS